MTVTFRRAIYRLCAEPEDRREGGTARFSNTAEYVGLAEQVAAIMLLSGCDEINDTGSLPPNAIRLEELESFGMDGDKLRRLFASGLFMSETPRRVRIIHRQIAEYLAGCRLSRVPMHQARAMLSRDGGHGGGIAGPLQEVGAWAACLSPDIAVWIADTDPELIGRSDVADEKLRRKALLWLLTKFRDGQLTAAQLHQDDSFFLGFRYADVEDDLRPILRERGSSLEDLHACVLELAEQWNLTRMSDIIATVALDSTVHVGIRGRAAHAIARIGDDASKERLKPLIYSDPDDAYDDLKGTALTCNWPYRITQSELLRALTLSRMHNYFGLYKYFIEKMVAGQIPPPQPTLEALRWACELGDEEEGETGLSRVAGQLMFRALDNASDPQVGRLLAQYLLRDHGRLREAFYVQTAAQIDIHSNHTSAIRARFEKDSRLRRGLIKELVEHADTEINLFQAMRSIPGLLDISDFRWLLEMAHMAPSMTSGKYAQLAAWLPWGEDPACVELWIELQSVPSIARHFPPISVRLDSEAAARGRELGRLLGRQEKGSSSPKMSRAEQVERFLLRCVDNPRWFGWLARALALSPDGTETRFERFITKTGGWREADESTRTSVLNAGKRLLDECPDVARAAEKLPLSSIPADGAAPALFLLIELEPDHLADAANAFWDSWAGYVVRELRFRLNDEPLEPKRELVKLLHRRRADLIRHGIKDVARRKGGESTLNSILEALAEIEDVELDNLLCTLVADRTVLGENLSRIMVFSLRRSSMQTVSACLRRLSPSARAGVGTPAVRASVALLSEQPQLSWNPVFEFFTRRTDVARQAIGQLSYGEPGRRGISLETIGEDRLGQLLEMMFTLAPPKNDPKHEGAHWVGPAESVVFLRDRLLGLISESGSGAAVATLRRLEASYGEEYPWLRYPRASAEQKARMLGWTPMKAKTIAQALYDQNAWVLKTHDDLLDLIYEAMEDYQRRLIESPALVGNLWNLPAYLPPSPKEEAAVSNNLLAEIRNFARGYLVTAQREVELRPRMLSRSAGGEPGQETDILVEAPAQEKGTGPLKVVIETKGSYNKTCRNAFRQQLFDRYLRENCLTHGLYVVAYFDAPGIPDSFRPSWATIDEAKHYLDIEAKTLTGEVSGMRVLSRVLDLRLR